MIKNTIDCLYKIEGGEEIKLINNNVGSTTKLLIQSKLRNKTARGQAKFSAIGLVLDEIILNKAIKSLYSNNSANGLVVYLEFNYKNKDFHAKVDDICIEYEEILDRKEVSDVVLSLLPKLMYYYVLGKKNSDWEEITCAVDALFMSQDETYVALACDAFYYGAVKGNSNGETISIVEDVSHTSIKKNFIRESFEGIVVTDTVEETKESEVYKVEYEWKEEQQLNIPHIDSLKNFVITDITKQIATKIKYRMDKVLQRMAEGKEGIDAIGPDYINLLMVGRPGTGKTALANAVAAMTGMPIYTIPFSKHTEEDVIEGKNKIVDGKPDFVETDFLKAYTNGGIIVCEEINLADPAVVMGSLGQAIERPFVVMKDGYIPVRRHPLCVIIGTMNTGTAGSKDLNQALSSRFKSTFVLEDPNKKVFINILKSQGYTERNVKYIYEAYNKIHRYLKDPSLSKDELCENITLRACFGALENIEEGQMPKDAIKNSLIGKIAEVDLETARDVERDVLYSLPEL